MPPVSFVGAAVSCLKLAVGFWTHLSFVNRGLCWAREHFRSFETVKCDSKSLNSKCVAFVTLNQLSCFSVTLNAKG